MHPFLQEIQINPKAENPLYIQIANQIVALIQRGILVPGFKFPGSRVMANFIGVHRQTVVAALEELTLEGWLVSQPKKGTFVSKRLPEVRPKKIQSGNTSTFPETTAFTLFQNSTLKVPQFSTQTYQFNDGIPDTRLAPMAELARHYGSILKARGNPYRLAYGSTQGAHRLRQAIVQMLSENRGIYANPAHVFITRGTIMGLYSLARLLFRAGDHVVVGETNYKTADMCFENAGAQLERIPVDAQGLCVDALSDVAQRAPIRAVYVTSHHHHPTTVPLSPERRLKLLDLAQTYHFAIIEDDYDYDFHYQNRPLLPLASADQEGHVIYIGSFTKAFAPAIRTGYIVAPENLIEELCKYRRILDRQGDVVLEEAIAYMIEDGTIKRFLNKALKAYRERKEYFCGLLDQKFRGIIDFTPPEGGMAVWAKFHPDFPLPEISQKAAALGLFLPDGRWYDPPGKSMNSCRMGFASMTIPEIDTAVHRLAKSLEV